MNRSSQISILGTLAKDALEALKSYSEAVQRLYEWRKNNPSIKENEQADYRHVQGLQFCWGLRCITKGRFEGVTASYKAVCIKEGMYTIELETYESEFGSEVHDEEMDEWTDRLELLANTHVKEYDAWFDSIVAPIES